MSLFGRRIRYDRKRILSEAERARARGRNRRAIALYRLVLAAEPRNVEIHSRIAPLLVKARQRFDAWQSYRLVAAAFTSHGQHGKALSIYQEATRLLPTRFEAWTAVARLELRLGEKRRARDSLIEGRRQMNGRSRRAEAIALLRSAREIDAWHAATVVDLAALLAASRRGEEARWLLSQLAERVHGRELARVRACQWRMEPSLRHSWYWLRDSARARRSASDVSATA